MSVPQAAMDEAIGRIVASFVIEKDGTITHVEMHKTSSPEFDLHFQKIFETMPEVDSGPAQRAGCPVGISFTGIHPFTGLNIDLALNKHQTK